MSAHADHVRSYYAALNTGDADAVAAHFTPDATHWYTRRAPDAGAQAIATNAALGVAHLGAVWSIEHLVEGQDEVSSSGRWPSTTPAPACAAWTAAPSSWPSPTAASAGVGTTGGRCQPSGDLVGFDHAARGHTVLNPGP